jgi:hypothetical protein
VSRGRAKGPFETQGKRGATFKSFGPRLRAGLRTAAFGMLTGEFQAYLAYLALSGGWPKPSEAGSP